MRSKQNIKYKEAVKYLVWEKAYSRIQYIGEELGKCKRDSSRIWEETKHRDYETRKVRDDRGKRFRRGELLEKYTTKILYRYKRFQNNDII